MKKIFGISSLIAIVFLLIPSIIFAQNSETPRKIVTLGSKEVVDRDYFGAGELVTISGIINGDAYIAGGQVLVDGIINGDLLVAGGMVTISGTVTQNVRAVGGQITVSGDIGRNLSIAGGSVEVTDNANIVGSLAMGAGTVNLNAPIGGNATIGAGSLTVSNSINGDLETGVGTLRLNPNANIAGNLTYWSEEEVSMADDAIILGEVTKNTVPSSPAMPSTENLDNTLGGIKSFINTASMLSTLIMGLLIIRLFPNFTKKAIKPIQERPLATFGIGFIALIFAPIASILLFITILGFPIGMLLFSTWMFFLYIGRVFVFIWLGNKILKLARPKIGKGWALLVGLFVYYILIMFPLLGGVIKLVSMLMGLGAVTLASKKTYLTARKEDIF